MSDFLNNFNREVYHGNSAGKEEVHQSKDENKDENSQNFSNNFNEEIEEKQINRRGELFEIDPDYQKQRQKKKIIICSFIFVLIILLLICYYFVSTIAMPNFEKKSLLEARTWAASNKMELVVKQKYDLKNKANTVIHQQEKKGRRVRKGKKITVIASKGANPNDKIKLPDFSKMSKTEAKKWASKNFAENISITSEYNDTVEKGRFIKQEISNPEINEANYRRKDKMIVYFSKGKEVFKKDITMPNFVNKSKEDVEAWVKKNEIQMTYEEIDSAEILLGSIISQSISANEKIAKRDSLTVQVSLGKATIVPNFSELMKEQATAVEGLNVTVKEQFSSEVGYGQLLSQSIAANTKLTSKDNNQVTVVYSAGRPYLKNLCDQSTTEGDLQKIFYEEYLSKGANIRYTTYYVDSAEPKGTVVAMSTMGQYVPLDFTVSIGISNGRL